MNDAWNFIESKIYASRRSKLRPEMISRPQGELKHTGHVGLDGAYFGDISFLGSGTKVKYDFLIYPTISYLFYFYADITSQYNHLPHQIVTPYKPQDDCTNLSEPSTPSRICSDRAPLLSPDKGKSAHSSRFYFIFGGIRMLSEETTNIFIFRISIFRRNLVGLWKH